MLARYFTLCFFVLFFHATVVASECLTVFPDFYNQANSSSEQLSNFPPNNSLSYIANGTTVPRGDNYYLGSALTNGSRLDVGVINNTERTARLFFRTPVVWENVKINEGGNPEDLIIVLDADLFITGSETLINAIIYVKGSLFVNGGTFNGALASVGSASGSASFNYDDDYINNADFNGMCEGQPQPSTEYRFDETSYDGSSNEVIDSISGLHGRAISTQPSEGKVCNAADLSASGIADYLILDEDILHGKTDFTISLWAKTAKTANQSFLSGAGSNNYNELLLWFSSHTNFQPHIRGGLGNISTTSIASDTWHHLVWTRSNDQNCFYRDSALQGCTSLSNVPLNIQSLILGQEQDSIGGSFDSGQSVEGKIDELLVFDSAISASQISQIYTNQNAGLGYDGTARTCPIEDAIPIANFTFDECEFTGDASDTIDQMGNYSATSQNALSSTEFGAIQRAADIDTYSQHFTTSIPVPSAFSVSTWFKKPTSTTGSQYFVLGAMQSGGDLLYLDRNNSWRWGVYDGASSTNGSYSFSSLDNNWHHMVLNYSGSKTDLYIDGVLVDTIARKPSGTLAYIGTSFDSIGTSSAQGFRAPLDEFIVFERVLSVRQIQAIYTEQLADNNYDGSTRDAVDCSTGPLALYRFEQTDFSTGILDTSGNDNHASNSNGISTASGKYCRAFDSDGANTASTTDNVFTSSLDLDDDVGTKGTISFWFNSNTAWDQGGYNGGERTLFDASLDLSGADKYFVLEIQSNGRLRFTFEDSTDADFSVEEPTSTVRSANTWYYVTVTWDYETDTFQLYVDATLRIEQTRNTNGIMSGLGPIVFGDNASTYSANGHTSLSSRTSANGKFDEVRIYKSVQDLAQITTDMNDNNGCMNNINHYQIIHDGNGLTCEPETITIKACTNIYDGTCTLSSDAVTLDVIATGSPVVTNNITFTGSTTTNIAYTTPESVVLSLANPTIAPESGTVCNDNSAGSCNLVFADAGFVFLNGGNANNVIDNQVSGDTFNTLEIQALYSNDGVCEGLFTGNVDVNLSQENKTPNNTNPGKNFEINGVPIAKGSTPSTNVTLNFGNDSIATIPSPRYLDAGQIQLHASYNDAGVSLVGSSLPFWVRPSYFQIDAVSCKDDGGGCDKDSPTTIRAGQPFDLTVTAYNSQNGITENYRQSDGQLQLKVTRVLPSLTGSFDGDFTYATGQSRSTSSGIFSNATLEVFYANPFGVSSFAGAQYDEVGVINVDVQDINYGGENLSIAAQDIDIGRFTPDHFKQTVFNSGTLKSTCNLGSTTFAYSGQLDEATITKGTIDYLANPILEITAFNAGNEVTKNYYEDSDGSLNDFMKMSATHITVLSPVTDNTAVGLDASKLPIHGDISTGTLSQKNLDASHIDFGNPLNPGVLHYKLSDNDHFYYQRTNNAFVANFDADFNLTVSSITDGDTSVVATSLTDVSNLSGVNIRFGRLIIENSFGPETENLPQVFNTQYYDGSKFVLNTDDQCSTYDVNKMTLSNISLAPTAKLGTTGSFVDGETKVLQITAPGAGNVGEMGVTYDSFDWLKYDWSNSDSLGNGPFTENPTAIATFGLFRGNDRIISWRELGN